MKKIKITSGDYAGRFVGPNIGGGPTTNADLFVDPETTISGLPYSLHKKTRCESVCGGQGCTDAGCIEGYRVGLGVSLRSAHTS